MPARLEKYVMMQKRQAQVERQASISYSGEDLTNVYGEYARDRFKYESRKGG